MNIVKPLTGRLVELADLGKGKFKWQAFVNTGKNNDGIGYGRKSRIFVGGKAEAKSFLRDFIRELENEQDNYSLQPLAEWLIYWVDDYAPLEYEWEQNTQERAKRIITKNISPYIGHIPLAELDLAIIKEFYSVLRTTGKTIISKTPQGSERIKVGYSSRTVKYVHTILNQALNEAVAFNKINVNPLRDYSEARKYRKKKGRANGKPQDKWVVLDGQSLYMFLNGCQGHRDYALIYTAAYTGARESELFGLTWDRVLWDISAIKIDHSLHIDKKSENGFEYRPRTKTDGSLRTIKITNRLLTVLKELKKEHEELGIKSNVVFTEPNGKTIKPDFVFIESNGDLIKRDNLGHRFGNLAKKLGHQGMHFHHLRHTHATILLSSGAYINEVSERLGHQEPTITFATYGHVLPDKDNTLAIRFDSLVSMGDDKNNKAA